MKNNCMHHQYQNVLEEIMTEKKLSPQKWLQQKIRKEEKHNIKLLNWACKASSSKKKKPCQILNPDVIYFLNKNHINVVCP